MTSGYQNYLHMLYGLPNGWRARGVVSYAGPIVSSPVPYPIGRKNKAIPDFRKIRERKRRKGEQDLLTLFLEALYDDD